MKHLIILRHAEAVPGGTDFSRKLTKNGILESRLTGKVLIEFLRTKGISGPEQILSSAALRAVQTSREIQKTLALPESAILILKSLYLPSLEQCLEAVWGCEGINTLLLCSHNPAMTTFGHYLLGWNGILPPGGFLVGSADIEHWFELIPGKSRLLYSFPET